MEEDWEICESLLDICGSKQEEETDPSTNTSEEKITGFISLGTEAKVKQVKQSPWDGNHEKIKKSTEETKLEKSDEATKSESATIDDHEGIRNNIESSKVDKEGTGSSPIKEEGTDIYKDDDTNEEKCTSQKLRFKCLYHSAKSRHHFQWLLNILRLYPDLYPKRYLTRLGQVLCNCKGNVAQVVGQKYSTADLHEIINVFLRPETELTLTNKQRDDTKSALTAILTPGSLNPAVHSLHRILMDASTDIYTLIQSDVERTAQQEVKEKEKDWIQQAVTLPLENQYAGFFIGKEGKHINTLVRSLGVKLSIASPTTLRHYVKRGGRGRRSGRGMGGYRRDPVRLGDNVVVEVVAATDDAFNWAKHVLIEKSILITSKRKKHEQNVQLYYKTRRSRGYHYSSYYYEMWTDSEEGAVGFVKELNRDAVNTPQKHRKGTHKKSNDPPKMKPAPILESSTCINCLGPYTGKENDKNACRYHAGYMMQIETMVTLKWPCCGVERHFTPSDSYWNPNIQYYLGNNQLNLEAYRDYREGETSSKEGCKKCKKLKCGSNNSSRLKVSKKTELAWSCCKEVVKLNDHSFSLSHNFTKEEKHKIHQETGCTQGLHTWRPQRSGGKSSSTVRSTKQGKTKSPYSMKDLNRSLKYAAKFDHVGAEFWETT